MYRKISDEIYLEFLEFILTGNRSGCTEIVEMLISRETDIREIYIGLFQRSLYRIGYLWEHNRISVAVEHLATSIVMNLLNLVYPLLFSHEKTGKKAVITCVANEYHQVGSQMVSDIFELNGWDAYYLGSNTPRKELITYVESEKPDLIGLSLAIYFNMKSLRDTVSILKKEFPGLPVLVGGQAFRWGGKEIQKEYPLVHYAGTLKELEALIARYTG